MIDYSFYVYAYIEPKEDKALCGRTFLDWGFKIEENGRPL
jgi:hypothetical protein